MATSPAISATGHVASSPIVIVWPGIFHEKLENGPNKRSYLVRNSGAYAQLTRMGERTLELGVALSSPPDEIITLVVPLQAVLSYFDERGRIGLLFSHKVVTGRDRTVWLAAATD